MATILIPIAVLSFHLKYCILYFTNFNFSFFILFFLLNMLTPSSTFLNIWSIVIRAVLMSLSTNCITYVISGSVYWLIWFFSLWVVFSCFNLQAWLKKSTSKKKKNAFQALWISHCWMLNFFVCLFVWRWGEWFPWNIFELCSGTQLR